MRGSLALSVALEYPGISAGSSEARAYSHSDHPDQEQKVASDQELLHTLVPVREPLGWVSDVLPRTGA